MTLRSTPTLLRGTARALPPGVSVPPGALDRWRAARDRSRTQLCEVAWFGDSTSFGQGPSIPLRPVPQGLRAQAVASGYPDGGVGLRGYIASALMSGLDNVEHVVSTSGGVWGNGSNTFAYGPLQHNSLVTTTGTGTSGASFTVQGKGTKVRLNEVTAITGYASWTYSVNGGAAVAVNVPTGPAGRRNRTTEITGLPGGGAVNAITITLTSDGFAEFSVEWLNATGIAFHNASLSGQAYSNRFPPTQGQHLSIGGMLGLSENAVTAEHINTLPTGPHAPALAVTSLGINDQQLLSADQATAVNSAALLREACGLFCNLCRSAGTDALVLIPHLLFASNFRPYEGLYRSAIFETASSFGVAVADMQVPLGNYRSALNVGVHLNQAGYDAQASWLWQNVLSA